MNYEPFFPRSYAGIGARATPPATLSLMTAIAVRLERDGFVLRSGGADGADSAFEAGVREVTAKLIMLPWRGFNGHHEESNCVWQYTEQHSALAQQYHPNWRACSDGARKLHTRNVAQILGLDCASPVRFVMCWTPGGRDVGGTGQAIRLAIANGVVVYNLWDETAHRAFEAYAAGGAKPYVETASRSGQGGLGLLTGGG